MKQLYQVNEAPAVALDASSQPSLKVLIVEDDRVLLTTMERILLSQNLDVTAVVDSRQALELVDQFKFHGIFSDLMMPGIDGFEFCRKVRNSPRNRNTPVVVISGREDRQTMQQAFDVGATFFLWKPIDRQRLVSLVRSIRGIMMEDRRNSMRLAIHLNATCRAATFLVLGNIVNLGLNGILFKSSRALKAGSFAQLTFELPDDPSEITVKVRVTRDDGSHHYGMQFVDLNRRDRDRLLKVIAPDEY